MLASEGNILIVEDDAALRHSLSSTLQALGFRVNEASTGENALHELRHLDFQVTLLDLNMPGLGGMEACRKIRVLYPRLQIIVLTARDKEEDKVRALDAGADDYVTKPFQLMELVARIRASVRRARTPESDAVRTLRLGEITLQPAEHRVFKADVEVHLTPKEFDLLHLLMQHAGKPLSHHRLLSSVWGEEYGNEREYLRTYMSQLRRKIEDDPSVPRYLTTENYIGYRFKASE